MPNASVSRRTQLLGAAAAVTAGLVVAFMIHLHPEGLHVPAWVAYVAASAFVLAGLCLLAGALDIKWLHGVARHCRYVVVICGQPVDCVRSRGKSVFNVDSICPNGCARCSMSWSLRSWSTSRWIVPRLARAPRPVERFLGGY